MTHTLEIVYPHHFHPPNKKNNKICNLIQYKYVVSFLKASDLLREPRNDIQYSIQCCDAATAEARLRARCSAPAGAWWQNISDHHRRQCLKKECK